MEPDPRDYIRDVYQSLTEIGAEADRTIDSRGGARTPKTSQASTPAVKVTAPPPPAPSTTTQRDPRPAANAAVLPVWNPFSVVAAALRTIGQNRVHAFWLGLLVVALSAIMSNVIILDNLRRGSREFDRGPLPAIVLVVTVYLLCWWIRAGTTGTATSAAKPKIADAIAAAAIGIAAYLVWPLVFQNVDVPLTVRWAASLTRFWPLHGLYASMILAPVVSSFTAMPPGTPFVEPFTHAASLIPAIPLIPFIVGEKVGRGPKLGHLLLRTPFLLAALALCTLPIAILNASLADWTLSLMKTRNTLPASIVMASIFYVQLLVCATTIGEFYRRVAASHP
jgi:hypothetical protein